MACPNPLITHTNSGSTLGAAIHGLAAKNIDLEKPWIVHTT